MDDITDKYLEKSLSGIAKYITGKEAYVKKHSKKNDSNERLNALAREYSILFRNEFLYSISCQDVPSDVEAKINLVTDDCIIVRRSELTHFVEEVLSNRGAF